ncbi:MAG TPA: hypothetical protein VFW59_04500 [Gallionella sp.]|nr:hypothetical protein [Gallionella sp.]
MNEAVNEPVKVVQFIIREGDVADLCLDQNGNVYKVEYSGRNELTLIKQTILVVHP